MGCRVRPLLVEQILLMEPLIQWLAPRNVRSFTWFWRVQQCVTVLDAKGRL